MADSFITFPKDDGSDDVRVKAVDQGDGTFAIATEEQGSGENVLVTNAGGASAVNIQDGGNSITVDGEVSSPDYALVMDEASSTVTYVGLAVEGTATSAASWKIKKITISGTVTSITWADGNNSFDNVWDNRASLSYS